MDGQWVVEYDPSRPGMSPDGIEMIAHLITTPLPEQARTFATLSEALDYWRQSYGMRWDGEPNRPLTAFSVAIEPAGSRTMA